MAQDIFGRNIVSDEQVQAAKDLGYTEDELNQFFQQTGRIRASQTLGGRASTFGRKATDILIPYTKKYFTQVATAPETLESEKLKTTLGVQAAQEGIDLNNPWTRAKYVVSKAPQIWGTALKEQLPPGAELAAYLSPQLKAAKGAGTAAVIGKAAATGAMAGTIGAIPRAMEAETAGGKVGQLAGGAAFGSVVGGGMAALGQVGQRGLAKGKEILQRRAVREAVTDALQKSNLGKQAIQQYADDVARGVVSVDDVLNKAYPVAATSRFRTSPGDEMILGQLRIGSKYAQNATKPAETLQYMKRWNLLSNDLGNMGIRTQQTAQMVDDVVNEAIMTPGGSPVKVENAYTDAHEALKRTIGLSPSDKAAMSLRLQDMLEAVGGYDDIGYVSRDKALDMYRAARNAAYIEAQKANKATGSVYSGISDEVHAGMSSVYRAFADDIAANLERAMPKDAVYNAFVKKGYADLAAAISPTFADDLLKASEKGLLTFNSQAAPLWKWNNAISMTLDQLGSPVYNAANAALNNLGRFTRGSLNPLSILEPFATSPGVNIAAGQAMNTATNLGEQFATSGAGQAWNKVLSALGSSGARRLVVPPAAAGATQFFSEQ